MLDATSVALESFMRVESRMAQVKEQGEVRVGWQSDPVGWTDVRLGGFLWSEQRRIAESVRDNRRTAVKASYTVGKALALDTPLPTPTGWTTMREVDVGDELLGSDGRPCRVIGISPVSTLPCRRVSFADGTSVVASDDHLWAVGDLQAAAHRKVADWRRVKHEIRTTEQIARSLHSGPNRRWRVPVTAPLETSVPWPTSLPRPYTFGAWLGDGTTAKAEITCSAEDAPHFVEALNGWDSPSRNERVRAVRWTKHAILDCPSRVLGGKRIPVALLRASRDDRLAMLRGIMDTDGFLVHGQGVGIDLCNGTLAQDVASLVRTFGWRPRVQTGPATISGRVVGTRWRMNYWPDVNPFSLPRKRDAWDALGARADRQRPRITARTIRSADRVPDQPVKCVAVDSPDHLYLAGEGLIPTHNSAIAARLACWWIDSHLPGEAFVVTTATSFSQVRAILWREINRAHAAGKLDGRVNQTEWWVGGEMVAMGRKPADYDQEAFAGIHARYVLVVLDEASGVPSTLWTAAEGLISNESSRILAIGNPIDPASRFAQVCKPDSGWSVVTIGAFDSPNFTGEQVPEAIAASLVSRTWVEERRADWTEASPMWQSFVLGQFPEETTDAVVLLSWANACHLSREPEEVPEQWTSDEPNELGVDVGAGGDETVVYHRRGARARLYWHGQTPDWPQATGHVVDAIRETGATSCKVDVIGIGWGVVGRLQELYEQGAHRCRIVGVNVAEEPRDPTRFVKLRDEIWWTVGRDLSRALAWDLREADEATIAQLIAPKYGQDSAGRIKVEKKEDTRRRIGRSPDRADALLLAYYEPNAVVDGSTDWAYGITYCRKCGRGFVWAAGRRCPFCGTPGPETFEKPPGVL